MADVSTILNSGDSKNRVDIVFVAEGYTANEREKFLTDAKKFLNQMLGDDNARLNAPFSNYKNYFNAHALFVASAESGTDVPNSNISVNTRFNATQHGSDGRLLYGDENLVMQELNSALPSNAQEMVIVLVNTALYGGAGGNIAWAAASNSSASELVLHEIGHSFADLQDEYVDLAIANNYSLTSASFLNSAHVTDSLGRIPWSAWLGYKDGELGTIGTFEGGYYRDKGIWRATQDSKMLHLGKPFSAPEKEAFALHYYAAIGDYLSVSSPIPGIFRADTPDPMLLAFTWKINGQTKSTSQSAYFDAYASGSYSNNALINLSTIDNSGYIRKNLAQTQQQENVQTSTAVTTLNGNQVNVALSNAILQFDNSDNLITLNNLTQFKFDYLDGGAGKDSLQINSNLANNPAFFIRAAGEQTQLLGLGDTAYWASHNIEKIQFNDFSVNTSVYQHAKAIKYDALSNIESLYIAYFNRIPDADGLDFWIQAYANGMSIKEMANAFYQVAIDSPALTGFSAKQSTADFVNTLYINALSRKEGADAEGLKFWQNNIDSGLMSRGEVVNAVLGIARDSANNPNYAWVANLLANKIDVATKFAVNWGLNYLTAQLSVDNGKALANAITPGDISAALKLIGINEGQIDFA